MEAYGVKPGVCALPPRRQTKKRMALTVKVLPPTNICTTMFTLSSNVLNHCRIATYDGTQEPD